MYISDMESKTDWIPHSCLMIVSKELPGDCHEVHSLRPFFATCIHEFAEGEKHRHRQ